MESFTCGKTTLSYQTSRVLSRILCLRGKSIKKSFFEPRSGEKNFLGLLGGPGASCPGKFKKNSVQNWLKWHFWTLVAFTDSLISSSNKSVFEIAFNFFRQNLFFFGGGEDETFWGKLPPQ